MLIIEIDGKRINGKQENFLLFEYGFLLPFKLCVSVFLCVWFWVESGRHVVEKTGMENKQTTTLSNELFDLLKEKKYMALWS